ncbi:MAG: flagellar hook-basal body complex protein FliE [Lacipirellulaceae bacterium]
MSPLSLASGGPRVLTPSAIGADGALASPIEAEGGGAFQDLLMDSIKSVNGMQQDADRAVESLFTGGDVSPAEVLTAVQKADMAFRMTMQVRNKLMDVYREIQEVRV